MLATDTEFVTAALRGDTAGVAGIYDRYADRLHSYAWSVCRSHADASDVVQDTFVTASERLGQLRDPERLRPWLYAIARNHALRVIKQRTRVEVDSEIEMTAEDPEPSGGLDAQQLVWAAAAGLDAKDRDILTLHLRQGLDGEDLAAALGVKTSAATVALFRVRERLEQAVGAVLLARFARGACIELDTMMASELTPLIRKRAARHINSCDDCQDGRRRIGSPAALFAATPAVLAPLTLRDTVLRSWGTTNLASSEEITSWRRDGFPDSSTLAPTHAPGSANADRSLRSARLVTAVGAVIVVAGLALFTATRSTADTIAQGETISLQAVEQDVATTVAAPLATAVSQQRDTTSPTQPRVVDLATPATATTSPSTPLTVTDPPAPAPAPAPAPEPEPTVTDPPSAPESTTPPTTVPDAVTMAVLEYECAGAIRLLVSGSSAPTVIVRAEPSSGAPIDVVFTESIAEPNMYEGGADVSESNRKISAIATVGTAVMTIVLDDACRQIG